MKSIFTFNEMSEVRPECVPMYGTTEYVISRYFWFFKAFHRSREIMEMYMKYINYHFDNAFEKLGMDIIEYKYPDNYAECSGKMEEYINETYGLDGECAINIDQALEVMSYDNYILGNIDIMTNQTAIDDIIMVGSEPMIFDDFDAIAKIFELSRYVLDKNIRDMIDRFVVYSSIISENDKIGLDFFNNDYVDEKYMVLYMLKRFVETEKDSC